MSMRMSRNCRASLRGNELTNQSENGKYWEHNGRGLSTVVSEDLKDLPAPVGIEEDCSNDEEELCDEDYKGTLTSEDASVI